MCVTPGGFDKSAVTFVRVIACLESLLGKVIWSKLQSFINTQTLVPPISSPGFPCSCLQLWKYKSVMPTNQEMVWKINKIPLLWLLEQIITPNWRPLWMSGRIQSSLFICSAAPEQIWLSWVIEKKSPPLSSAEHLDKPGVFWKQDLRTAEVQIELFDLKEQRCVWRMPVTCWARGWIHHALGTRRGWLPQTHNDPKGT